MREITADCSHSPIECYAITIVPQMANTILRYINSKSSPFSGLSHLKRLHKISSCNASTIFDNPDKTQNSETSSTSDISLSCELRLLLGIKSTLDSSPSFEKDLEEFSHKFNISHPILRLIKPVDSSPRDHNEWKRWNDIWPLATPRPPALNKPYSTVLEHVGIINYIMNNYVFPAARKAKALGFVGIAAAVMLEPFENFSTLDEISLTNDTKQVSHVQNSILLVSGKTARMSRKNPIAYLPYSNALADCKPDQLASSDLPKQNSIILDHPVTILMKRLSQHLLRIPVSNDSLSDRDAYLATDRDVLLSHEPCVMCSMALVHSRVRHVFYAFPNKSNGGLGSCAKIHLIPSLNHHFNVFTDLDINGNEDLYNPV